MIIILRTARKSSVQGIPGRIVSVLMSYIYIEKYHLPISHFIYFKTNHSY